MLESQQGVQQGCQHRKPDGGLCGATRLRGGTLCFWHDPEHAEAAKEARRLGGLRHKRESTLQGVYDVGVLASVDDIRRILQIATLDTLGLENSVARNRTLGTLALAALKCLEVGELEQRVEGLEQAVKHRDTPRTLFMDEE